MPSGSIGRAQHGSFRKEAAKTEVGQANESCATRLEKILPKSSAKQNTGAHLQSKSDLTIGSDSLGLSKK